MKKITTILTLIFLSLSFSHLTLAKGVNKKALGYKASDWDIYSDDYGKYLGLKKVKMKMIKIESLSGSAKIVRVEHPKEAPYLSVIHYDAGSAGTSKIIHSFRAVVFNTRTQTFLGQAAVKYESSGEEKVADWNFLKKEIVINDPFEGKKTIKIE